MRHPKELSIPEMAKIAFEVRCKLETQFGVGITEEKMRAVGPLFFATLLKQTYIAVREQLEKELDE